MDLFEYDRMLNVSVLCGVDEAGRGPLAGDVYAAAAVLPEGIQIEGLNDSKKLTEKKRELLYEQIVSCALDYCVATATAEEIDQCNILNATFLAMKRAVEGLKQKPELVLVDGNRLPSLGLPAQCLVKGDGISASVAAASILAKVSRDHYMKRMAEKYPEYQFEKHKGYGTKLHYELLDRYGPCEIHRKSFLKKLQDTSKPNGHLVGIAGEKAACIYLEKHGYEIVARNYRSTYGEIDIIARNEEILAFVEVKTRAPHSLIAPAAAVNQAKQGKIVKTALSYLSEFGMALQPRFDVAEILLRQNSKPLIHYIENAFTSDGLGKYL